MPTITLPDGSQRSFDQSVSILDVANDIGAGLARATLAGTIDGEQYDASHLIEDDIDCQFKWTAVFGPDNFGDFSNIFHIQVLLFQWAEVHFNIWRTCGTPEFFLYNSRIQIVLMELNYPNIYSSDGFNRPRAVKLAMLLSYPGLTYIAPSAQVVAADCVGHGILANYSPLR